MKDILIYGSKEFGIVIKDLVDYLSYPFIGFIDDFNTGPNIIGDYQYVKKKFSAEKIQIVIAIGYGNLPARWQIYQKVKNDFSVMTLIHETAYIRNIHNIGAGSIIMSNVTIDSNAKISELVVAWPGVVISHDSFVGNNSFLSPNCTVCGSVKIGCNCFIGAGAIIVDHNEVMDNSFIKAGQIYYKSSKCQV